MSHPLVRIVPLSLAVGALVAAVTAASPSGPPGPGAAPIESPLPPAQTSLVCPPPPALAAGAEAAGTDAGFAAQPVAPVSAFTALSYRTAGTPPALEGLTIPMEGPPEALPIGGTPAVAAIEGSRPTPVFVSVSADEQGSSPLGTLTTTLTTDGDLAGLAASTCSPPAASGWLVGGGVAPGRSGRIVLSNPGATPVTVNLQILTEAGPQTPPAAQGIVVPPASSRQLLLEGLVSDAPAVAIGYTASGGQLAVNLVDTRLAGIVPRGVEQIPTTSTSSRQVITGLPDGGAVMLRLAAPGEAAQVNWRFIGTGGTIASTGDAGASIAAGHVQNVRIDLPPGTIGVEITSPTPILAAITDTVERDGANGRAADFGVASSTTPLARRNLVAAAGQASTTLGLVASSDGPATVEVRQVDANGTAVAADQTLALPADTAATVKLTPGARLAVIQVSAGSVSGAQWLTAGDAGQFVAGAPIQPPATSQKTVRVQVSQRP